MILKSARIEGDVHYETLTIEQGANVNGRFAPDAAKPPAAEPRSAPPSRSRRCSSSARTTSSADARQLSSPANERADPRVRPVGWARAGIRLRFGRFGGALGGEPGFGFGFLRRFDRGLRRVVALGAQLLDQRGAVVAGSAIAAASASSMPGALGRLGDRRVELALRAQAERDRVLRLDVLDVPVACGRGSR